MQNKITLLIEIQCILNKVKFIKWTSIGIIHKKWKREGKKFQEQMKLSAKTKGKC